MKQGTRSTTQGTKMIWAGRIISVVAILALALDGVVKLTRAPQVLQAMAGIGYPAELTIPLGILVLACTVMYAIPRTSVLGAVALTAFLGGATAAKVRMEEANFVVSVVLGLLVWAGIYLRDARLRALLPFRKSLELS